MAEWGNTPLLCNDREKQNEFWSSHLSFYSKAYRWCLFLNDMKRKVHFIFLIIVGTVVDTVCGHKIVYNDYCKQWPESRVRATYLRSPCYPGCCLWSRTSCWGRCRTWWRGTRGRGAVRTPPRLRISYLKQNIYQDYHHYHHLHSWESITWRD